LRTSHNTTSCDYCHAALHTALAVGVTGGTPTNTQLPVLHSHWLPEAAPRSQHFSPQVSECRQRRVCTRKPRVGREGKGFSRFKHAPVRACQGVCGRSRQGRTKGRERDGLSCALRLDREEIPGGGLETARAADDRACVTSRASQHKRGCTSPTRGGRL
jgi:hypothetical protein